MTIEALAQATGAEVLTKTVDLSREAACGFSCDLLSWVMAHGQADMAWVTVQTHMNVIAVATLHDMACVIIPEGNSMPADVLAKAEEEGVAVLASPKGAYELCGLMWTAGLRGE